MSVQYIRYVNSVMPFTVFIIIKFV